MPSFELRQAIRTAGPSAAARLGSIEACSVVCVVPVRAYPPTSVEFGRALSEALKLGQRSLCLLIPQREHRKSQGCRLEGMPASLFVYGNLGVQEV